MLCTCHCTVKSRYSQIGKYKCIIIFVASCIKYILVAMVVSPSLWITHCQCPPWWCTSLVTCTTSAALVTTTLTSPPHEGGDSGEGDGGHTGGDGGEVTGAVVRGPVRPRPSDCTGHLAVKSRPRHQQSIHHQPQQHRHRAGAPHTAEPHPAAA